MSAELSDLAKETMCGLFFFGRGTVRSSPPHSTVKKNQSVFDELINAGLVVKEPFNNYDVWVYKPTELMEVEAGKHRKAYFMRHLPELVPDTDASEAP